MLTSDDRYDCRRLGLPMDDDDEEEEEEEETGAPRPERVEAPPRRTATPESSSESSEMSASSTIEPAKRLPSVSDEDSEPGREFDLPSGPRVGSSAKLPPLMKPKIVDEDDDADEDSSVASEAARRRPANTAADCDGWLPLPAEVELMEAESADDRPESIEAPIPPMLLVPFEDDAEEEDDCCCCSASRRANREPRELVLAGTDEE